MFDDEPTDGAPVQPSLAELHTSESVADQPTTILAALQASRERIAAEEAHQARLIARYLDTAPVPVHQGETSPGAEHLREVGDDGTPAIAEFAAREIGFALHTSPATAARRVTTVLNLQYRLPRLWDAVLAAQVPLWRAADITDHTHELTQPQARWVDEQLDGQIPHLGRTRLRRLLEGLVAVAAPQLVQQRQDAAIHNRIVDISPVLSDGTREVAARLWAADAAMLTETLTQLSDALKRHGSTATADQRRADAFALLATPQRAADLLAGHPTAPQRRAVVYVHLSADTLTRRPAQAIARVENTAPYAATALGHLLHNCQVQIRPILHPDRIAPVDAYEIPDRIREAVILAQPVENYPYSSRAARHCDLDHTQPWQPDGPPNQTRTDNLTPLSRTTHRAKTHARWRYTTHADGHTHWISPAGQRLTITPTGLTAPPGATVQHRQTQPPPQPAPVRIDFAWRSAA